MRRGAPALLVVAAALVAVAVWVWQAQHGGDGEAAPPPPEIAAAAQRALAARMADQVNERAGTGASARTRLPAGGVPEAATNVRVRVVDAGSGQPIEGARAFDLKRAEVCATADAAGALTLPDLAAGRIALVADGYLTKLARAGDDDAAALAEAAASGRVADLELRRDDYTLPCTLRFVDALGAPVTAEVRFTITCLDEPPPSGLSFPSGRIAPGSRIAAGLADAWQRHVAVQPLLGAAAAPLHLGVHSHGQVFAAGAGSAALRFVGAGSYRVDAVAPAASLAGGRVFAVALAAGEGIEVKLAAGRFAHGVVVDARSGQPIAGASVRLQEPGAAPHGVDATDAAGAFRVGPVAAARVRVHVHSRRHAELDTVVTVGEASRIALAPLPVRSVRGVVRRQPGLQPLAGVEVQLRSGHLVDVAGETAASGAFALETTAEAPELVVRAPGYLTWIERIDEPHDSYACDLIPATADARVQAGLTALVEGRLLGADGRPVAGMPVQLFTGEAFVPEGIAGRAILEGHIVPLAPLAVTGDDGTFTLEWHRAGVVRLVAADGASSNEEGVPVTLVLGQRLRDIVLRVRAR